jgi:hypothetical protein
MDLLMKFAEASPKAANSLAQFWWSWGVRECFSQPFMTRLTTEAAKKTDKSERDIAEKQLQDEVDNCIEAFMFDRWKDINDSVANKFREFPKDNSPLP